jgi:Tfp pilus assembly protein PilF
MRTPFTLHVANRFSFHPFLILALVIVNGACAGKASDTGPGQTAAAGADEAQLMQKGTSLLYQTQDPIGAEAVFRGVLQRNPTHYGAQYQLAVSLDRGGKPREARRLWERVLRDAENARDSTTARTARSRLAAPDTASQGAMMALGLDLLYKRNDAATAADQFRKVLERNPTHYGATYQLATALDKAGRAAQARPVWEKVLGMAVTYKDDRIAEAARNRLR